jgi:hypothetical protein
MSIRHMARVWEDSPYEGKALLVHLALADFASDDGIAFPSQTRLARKSRSTVEWVRKTLARFEADGHAVRISEGGGRGQTAQWQLKWPNSNGGAGETPNSSGSKPPTPAAETPNSAQSLPIDELSVEPSLRTVSVPRPFSPAELFDAFWERYPSARRIDKRGCQAKFVKAMRADPTVDIIGGLDRWLAHWEGADPKFVTLAATWLNQRRWETDPGPPNRAKVGPSNSRAFRAAQIDNDRDAPSGVIEL